VIIPVWNDAPLLRETLARLSGEPGVFEVIVVDGGSRDAPTEVARRFPGVRFVASRRGRGAQMNHGARLARGGVLLFLHCDTKLPPGAIADLPRFLESRSADFGAFRVRCEPRFRLLDALALLTRLAKPWCCFGDQGIFARREFFQRTGGFPETPLLEDVHWIRRAAKAGRMVRSPRTAVTSSRRFVAAGLVRQLCRNLVILLRDRLGHETAELEKIYRGIAGQTEPPRRAGDSAPKTTVPVVPME
jgi:rSAM/selenodomain-associated transferase 2